mmetsp:Transcript_29228/g.72935  ORF Transcript_29228/g.72935 Transcript_29228/m.72935 type:complete len:212 (-) Transcript_29228:698-1333(-)
MPARAAASPAEDLSVPCGRPERAAGGAPDASPPSEREQDQGACGVPPAADDLRQRGAALSSRGGPSQRHAATGDQSPQPHPSGATRAGGRRVTAGDAQDGRRGPSRGPQGQPRRPPHTRPSEDDPRRLAPQRVWTHVRVHQVEVALVRPAACGAVLLSREASRRACGGAHPASRRDAPIAQCRLHIRGCGAPPFLPLPHRARARRTSLRRG